MMSGLYWINPRYFHGEGQCYLCIKPFVELSPKSGSLTTTFSSGVTGTFYIVAYYQENPGDEYISDYTEVKVE